MVLYRPRAASYHEAMRHIKIFDDVMEVDNYIIDYHNLYNVAEAAKTDFLLHGDGQEMNDERNGWKHSRYVLLGNVPLGIFDADTIGKIPKPQLKIEEDYQNGLNCQFTLLDSTYIFFLGMDQWANTTQCTGYNTKDMQHKIFRRDNLAINRPTFRQLLYNFIADTAIKEIQTAEKAAQLHQKTRIKTGVPASARLPRYLLPFSRGSIF